MPRLSRWIYRRGLGPTRAYLNLGKRLGRRWAKPIEALRHRIGLPASSEHPLFEGQLRGEGVDLTPLFDAEVRPIFGEKPQHAHDATGRG